MFTSYHAKHSRRHQGTVAHKGHAGFSVSHIFVTGFSGVQFVCSSSMKKLKKHLHRGGNLYMAEKTFPPRYKDGDRCEEAVFYLGLLPVWRLWVNVYIPGNIPHVPSHGVWWIASPWSPQYTVWSCKTNQGILQRLQHSPCPLLYGGRRVPTSNLNKKKPDEFKSQTVNLNPIQIQNGELKSGF